MPFISFFCIFPWSGCHHPHFRRRSARGCAHSRSQPLVGSFVRALCRPLSDEKTEECCLVVVGNKTDLAPGSTDSAISEGAPLDFIDELVPLSGSPSSSLATQEDERGWIPTQGPDRVSRGSDDEVVAHDNGSLESCAASPVDIILADETHSASVVHHNDVGSDRENSIPTFAILPRIRTIDLHDHHHKHLLKARSRTSQFSFLPHSTLSSTHTGFTSFQSLHMPASSISDGYEPYHSAHSSPRSHSRSPSPSPSLHNHRSYHSLSASTMSTSTV
jgi:Ras-related protein Rab-7A